jgi:hypothetical protein
MTMSQSQPALYSAKKYPVQKYKKKAPGVA